MSQSPADPLDAMPPVTVSTEVADDRVARLRAAGWVVGSAAEFLAASWQDPRSEDD